MNFAKSLKDTALNMNFAKSLKDIALNKKEQETKDFYEKNRESILNYVVDALYRDIQYALKNKANSGYIKADLYYGENIFYNLETRISYCKYATIADYQDIIDRVTPMLINDGLKVEYTFKPKVIIDSNSYYSPQITFYISWENA